MKNEKKILTRESIFKNDKSVLKSRKNFLKWKKKKRKLI
jgi:hypothetical protein